MSSEPLRRHVAGIGIRYLELARRLPSFGIDVVAISPCEPAETPLPDGSVRRFEAGRLKELLSDCDGVVAQGALANHVLLECPDLPVAIDLYDPWLIENLHYTAELGLAPYRHDHATWVLQLSRGDFFLCSSEEQRLYYLGFLTALGRVNPVRVQSDPDLMALIAPVPFGLPDTLPPQRPVLEQRRRGEVRILFGALYDWYDPWTLLNALQLVEDRSPELPWELTFVRHPNPDGTPQRLRRQVEETCRSRGWWGNRVQEVDWVPFERRYDLLRDVDLLVAPHQPSLETRLAMRTRFLEALAAGCRVVTCEGGTVSRLIAEHDAGWVVPPGDPESLAVALDEAISEAQTTAPPRHAESAARLAERFSWDRVIEPLVTFCRDPRADPTKKDFAFRPTTAAPANSLGNRVRRRLGRVAAQLKRRGPPT